jgi:nitrogen fixation NifU-like protein
MDSNLRRSIILDNYNNPNNRQRHDNDDYIKNNSRNISCIDNIDVYVKIEDNTIKDITYEGEACAISISSSSIISNLLKDKTLEQAKEIINNYYNMIEEKEYNKELLEEANVFDEIYKQPSRKMCATLIVRGIEEIINKNK